MSSKERKNVLRNKRTISNKILLKYFCWGWGSTYELSIVEKGVVSLFFFFIIEGYSCVLVVEGKW